MDFNLTWQTGMTIAVVALGVVASIPDRRRLAALWAFFLPIDFVTAVPVGLLDAIRYAGAAALGLLWPATLPDERRRRLHRLGLALILLGGVRLIAATAHHDPNGTQFALVLLAATAVAYVMAIRPAIHSHLIGGFMAGMTLSVVTALMQAMHWPALRAGNNEGHRYPGLSTYTMLFTWQVVLGLIVLGYLVTVGAKRRSPQWWLAAALIPLYLLALLTNGAQGGLLGLGSAALALAWGRRRDLTASKLGITLVATGAALAAIALVVLATNINVPTVSGFREGNYRNETARLEVASNGWNEFLDHPLTGMSRSAFISEYGIAPHFLPIDSAATAGVVGLVLSVGILGLLAAEVVRGPGDDGAWAQAGHLGVVVMAANTLTDAYGPFVGIARSTPLWIALVISSGYRHREDDLPATDSALLIESDAVSRAEPLEGSSDR